VIEHLAAMAYECMDVKLHTLIPEDDEDKWSSSCFITFKPRERIPFHIGQKGTIRMTATLNKMENMMMIIIMVNKLIHK
jgi:hypothetical protein